MFRVMRTKGMSVRTREFFLSLRHARVFFRSALIAMLLALPLLSPGFVRAGDDAAAPLKAAFLYHFVSFVEWPETAFPPEDMTFDIAILGPDPFGDLLEATVGEKDERGRRFRFHRIEEGDPLDSAHILFIAEGYEGDTSALMDSVQTSPVLTVSDRKGFATDGGMVGFFLDGGKLRFEVNRNTVERSSLSMSSRMLVLAKIVEGDGRGR